jgi:2-oxoglutarate dehydrogenase E1 component
VKRNLEDLYKSSHLSGSNASYIEAYYEDWLVDAESVPSQWAKVFSGLGTENGPETGHLQVQEKFRQLGFLTTAPVANTELSDYKEARVVKLITAYRIRGHEAANLNPLGEPHHEPVADLDPLFHGLDAADLEREFDTATLFAPDRMKLSDIIKLCERVYCGSIGVESIHITNTGKRRWLQERLETGQGLYDVNDEERLRILQMLTAAEGLEKYLHTRYVGQKRFSLEGGDSLIPLLHETMLHSGAHGVEEVVMGMAHRGRL